MEVQGTSGMTMRDYFAAKAMQGLFAAPGFNSNAALDAIARDAYKLADAMLLERAK